MLVKVKKVPWEASEPMLCLPLPLLEEGKSFYTKPQIRLWESAKYMYLNVLSTKR